ncbi:Cas4 exonuclease [Mycobacterium phage SemperFi]|uniref:Cas4 exonuclease n=1 Tax=Mycobacterium phage Georgie2 TaxID=2743928 RepID=A0A7D5K5M0_9CAUD|nr:exonuclease [Mycobacterium phage SweetiePie]YP_010063881.1 exonuclease [Mycobacterium phage Georgie2]ATN91917.1 Cas4 exonuclease [Mycobacterium phage SnapTap]AXC33207.1 Cas4 exonuclease [Mycobacterium phage Crucio]AXQ53000.1 Cas4 exonuclease [Mycobacterium phage QueenBeesly]QFG11873.1 Cas4 exonuclease [Mycobacterium phage SemperFi]QKY80139.1 Cas4 exonuclease [Mycobacterium Phage FiringLine]
MTETIEKKLPLRSVSQINQYTRCPMAYKLARIDKVWARPAAWLPQGTAFHTVAEVYEKALAEGREMDLERAQEIFREEYAKDIGELCAETPNFDWWFHSGPYNGERDIERRFHIGLEQVEKFIAWRTTKGQTIWVTPEGKPAIELSFNIELDGIKVRGYIDAVVVVNGELRVRDYKTGNKPGDDFQLGVYALAVSMLFGIEPPRTGDYFMAGKKGKKPVVTEPYDLTEWTRERITERFQEVEAKIQAGEFPAMPETDKCNFCDVSYSCPVFQ